MKATLPLLALTLTLAAGGCSLWQKTDAIRMQRIRNAAGKFATGAWPERVTAVREIITYYGPGNNTLIIDTLASAVRDTHPSVRIEAVKSLGRIPAGKASPIIRKLAMDEKEGNVRWYALRALRSSRDSSNADVFTRALESEDWLIREEAIRGILALDDTVIRKRMVPVVIRAMNDPRANVSLAALNNMRVKDERLYRAIADRFNAATDFQYSFLEASLRALEGYRLDRKTREKVIDLLVHRNVQIRLLALRVLKKDDMTRPADNK